MKVGFIGVGLQGSGMAQMIARSGHDLGIWARRPEVLPPFVALGARAAGSAAELAAGVELLGLCVVSDADVMEVVFERGVLEAMPRGSLLAIHSTVDPATCEAIALRAAPRGIAVLDAPVSGSTEAALERKLVVLVGGEPRAVARARAVFESFSDCIIELGPLGSGQRTKLVNNLVFAANAELARAALALGARMGIDPGALQRALSSGSARSFAMDKVAGLFSPAHVSHVIRLFEKDIGHAVAAARQAGADPGLLERVARELVASLAAADATR
jgi:3-hydroxyisobutyrate dehydrogenase-like beta-hydroxyacid dehydrogenase